MNRLKERLKEIDDWFGYNYPILYILFRVAVALFLLWFIINTIHYIILLIVFLSITPPWEN